MKTSGKNPWKVMPGDAVERVEQWRPPSFFDPPESAPAAKAESGNEPAEADEPRPVPPTLEEIERIQQQARDEGYEQGRKEGFEYGHREALEEGGKAIKAKLERLDDLMCALEAPFKELDDQVERELLTLVVSMVRQLVRREVHTDPNQIVGVMREAMALLPVNSRDIRVQLHPDDAEIVRELYTVADADHSWQLVEDPVVQRGGCRVITQSSQVDATLESRLQNLIAPLMGGLRTEDQEPDDEN